MLIGNRSDYTLYINLQLGQITHFICLCFIIHNQKCTVCTIGFCLWQHLLIFKIIKLTEHCSNCFNYMYFTLLWSCYSCYSARQEEESLERKLDYKELTPCLRDVTKVWEDLLNAAASGNSHTVIYSTLLECVKKGMCIISKLVHMVSNHYESHHLNRVETSLKESEHVE